MNEWPKIRQQVLERDGYKCRYIQCQETNRLHIHHIDPKGKTELDNLITLCGRHHALSEPRKVAVKSDYTVIRVSKETKEILNRIGSRRETYDDILVRLMEANQKK